MSHFGVPYSLGGSEWSAQRLVVTQSILQGLSRPRHAGCTGETFKRGGPSTVHGCDGFDPPQHCDFQ
jgi:hypothetical protein